MELSRGLLFPDTKTKVLGGIFPKDKRFTEPVTQDSITSDLDYNPNFDIKYRKAAAAVIKRDENREALRERRKAKRRLILPELTTSEKVNLSILTADTEAAVPGPGAYSITFAGVEVVRHVGISKASRFESQKKDECSGLDVRYTLVDNKVKGVKIAKPAVVEGPLVKKRQEELENEERRAKRELEAMKEREQSEKERMAKEVWVERVKTEKERLLELFRLVGWINDSWTDYKY